MITNNHELFKKYDWELTREHEHKCFKFQRIGSDRKITIEFSYCNGIFYVEVWIDGVCLEGFENEFSAYNHILKYIQENEK